MAIATDIEVNWRGTVDETNKIGLSSTLNLLGVNVFDNADYCLGFQNPALKLTKESEGYPKSTEASNNVAFYISNNVGYSLNGFNNPDGAYYRTLLFAVPTNWAWGWDSNLRSNNDTVRIVTKLDLSKNKAYLTTLETTKSDRVTSNNLIYGVNESLPDTGAVGILLVGNVEYKILCGNIYLTDNGYYIKFPEYIDPLYDNFNAQYGEGAVPNFNYDTNSNMMFSAAPVMFSNAGWTISIGESGPAIYNVSTYDNTEVEVPPSADNSDYKIFGTYSRVGNFYWRIQYQMSVEYWLWLIASFGLLFDWNGTAYKPIIQYGELKGYTNDMTVESDIDNWTDVSGHNISPTPPVPPPTPSGDDIDVQHFGGGTGLGGAENLWLLTTAQMQSLHAAISSCNEPNFEPLNSIISVIGLAIPPTYPLGTDISTLITITFKKADGTRWSSHVEGHICDKQTAAFGFTNNIKIKRRYNNFLDYPPYANHEIFLPLCGWLPLPAYAVGRNLQVYYVHDINTCSVRALVLCEGSVIGEKYGTMGANIAFSSNGHALYLGGLITGGVQTLADFTTAMISEGPMALMSAMKGIADGANTLISANQNRTSVIGQNQDRTSFADGQYIRIKSTYPDVKIEENFGHTYGFVCNKKGLLKDFKGFTTCENPHVTGFSCTSDEKDEIERLLKAGIIINISEE